MKSRNLKIKTSFIRPFVLVCSLMAIASFYSCSDNPNPESDDEGVGTSMSFSTAGFADGATIPVKYTCDGIDVCPKLEWSGAPEGTLSFAIIIDDPDAVPVAGYVWDHCLIANLPASVTSIQEGVSAQQIGALGGFMLKNSFDKFSYNGPCPPPDQVHKYEFELYALDVAKLPGVTATSKKSILQGAIDQHKIGEAIFTGDFSH